MRLAAGAALLAVAVAIGMNALPGASDPSSPAAVRALDSVAGIAAAQADAATPAPFTYSKVTSWTLTTSDPAPDYSYLSPTSTESWIAEDGSGRVLERLGTPVFAGPRDRQRWIASGSPALSDRAPGTVEDRHIAAHESDGSAPGAEGLPPTHELPTSVGALQQLLHDTAAKSSVPTDVKMFELASAVLMQTGSSPQLRSTLFNVVAAIHGVHMQGNVHDPLGRTGTGVSITSGYSGAPQRDTLIFDADTAQPLASVTTLQEPQPWIDGTEAGSIVLNASAGVDSTSERP